MINFIQDNRFSQFVDKLVYISLNVTDPSYLDTSPNNIFDGFAGTILIKNGSDILFKEPSDQNYTSLTNLLPYVVKPNQSILSNGANTVATWMKTGTNYTDKTWVFLGYYSPFDGNCSICQPPTYF